MAVLDRVYSSVQCVSPTKKDSIIAAVELHARAAALNQKQRSSTNSVPAWMCQQLQLLLDELLLGPEGEKKALKLKEMSTGKMEGFGSGLLAVF